MTKTQTAEDRQSAARPAHVRALENTLGNYRNALLADLARGDTPDKRAIARDQIRDLARLIRNGILPLAIAWNAEGTDPAAHHHLKAMVDELDGFAHPAGGIPAQGFNAACAHCPLVHDLPRKLELLAAGIGRLSIRNTQQR